MWRVIVSGPAQKAVDRLPVAERDRIVAALEGMAGDPFGGDVKKLKGGGGYRRRVGAYRICFDTDHATQQVSVTEIERRTSTTYRKR